MHIRYHGFRVTCIPGINIEALGLGSWESLQAALLLRLEAFLCLFDLRGGCCCCDRSACGRRLLVVWLRWLRGLVGIANGVSCGWAAGVGDAGRGRREGCVGIELRW
jgi:hypothetical protein